MEQKTHPHTVKLQKQKLIIIFGMQQEWVDLQ